MSLPKVFIGSSVEGLQVAKAIQENLEYEADVTIWSQGVFGLGKGTLETLVERLDDFDFAILVATPNDFVVGRGEFVQAPRDNVLLELGLFVGRLGRDRTFLVYDRTRDLKLPSDLAGVTHADYRPHESGGLFPALGASCTKFKRAFRKLGSRVPQEAPAIRKRMEYHVSIHDSVDTITDFEVTGLATPSMRRKGESVYQLNYTRYHLVRCTLAYTRSQRPQEGLFSVALASESAKLAGWFREPSVLYRELMTLAPEDSVWWSLLINDLRRPRGDSERMLESQIDISREVARFEVRINHDTIHPCGFDVPRSGGFLLKYKWPSLNMDDPIHFQFDYVGLQSNSQTWFPLFVAEPSESVELTFDYSLNDSVNDVECFEAFDSSSEPIIIPSAAEQKVTIHHAGNEWVRYGGAFMYWRRC